MRHSRHVSIAVLTGLVVTLGSALPVNAALPLRKKACGALITRSFKLKNDMDCRGDALKVGKGGIVIDLNGKTIRGDGGDDDNGVENEGGFDDVTIMSGRGRRRAVIKRFDHAVKLGGGAQANTIRRLSISKTLSHAIDIEGGSGHRIIGNRVTTSGKNGILLIGDDGVLRSNVATGNTLSGIHVDGDGNLVVSNAARDNDFTGINITGDDNDVTRSDAVGNALNGIGVAGDINNVTNNDVRTNQITGIHISGDANEVRENTVCGTASLTHIDDQGTNTILADNSTADACGP